MAIGHVSSKGQITLPSALRKEVGIASDSKVEILVRDAEIVIKPVRSVREVYGILHKYIKDKPTDWETEISETEALIAREVADEGRR